MEQGPLMRKMTSHANKKGMQPGQVSWTWEQGFALPTVLKQVSPKQWGDEQHVNRTQSNPTILDQGIPQNIGNELHENSAQDLPMVLGQETPKQ